LKPGNKEIKIEAIVIGINPFATANGSDKTEK